MPRRRRKTGLLGRLVLGLLLLLLAVPAGLFGVVWWTLPPDAEELRIEGLTAPTRITLDAQGIPRVHAATERDAAIAMGYLHARDRLFQMEMMRRGAEGRLAEVAGSGMLRLDRFSRTLGLKQAAEADFAALDAETRGLLEAYAAGVNALIADRGRFAAPEFLALGPPEPWQPQHSLLWAKVMGLWLSGNWRAELERARLAARLPAERLWELWPADRSAGRPDVAALDGMERILAAIPVFGEDAPLPRSASNAWAVAGSRSASGAPLLASDPHLGYGAPILWYLARIELADGRILSGATAPGTPLIIIGRNADLAWGFTTTHSDTQDVFLETPADIRRTRTETILVRGGEPVTLTVRETANGPVISDLDETPRLDGRLLSVRMANLEPRDTSAQGFLLLNRARSIAEARAAAALIASPPQNLMVADRAGGIAMYLTGRTPIRASGDGSLPVPGNQPWRGFVPFDDLPHVENPASGILVNANNRVSPEGHPVHLSREWYGDWRFRRIHDRLAAEPVNGPAEFAAIQMDTLSLLAKESLPFLNSLPRGTGPLGQAQALLAEWDGEMAPGLPQPLIWNAFARRLPVLALRQARVPEARGTPEFLRFLLTAPEAGWWCGGDCRAMAALALAESVAELGSAHGQDPTQWRWGQAHQARFEHPLLRFIPGVNRLIGLSVPVGGDGETVQRQSIRAGGADPYQAMHGAGLRFVADLGAPDASFGIIATGQSGHPLSRHWGDLLETWRTGGMLRLGREAAQVTASIRLAP
ncbi:penicillin acylase family protein [Roseococcus sp. SDR]|uniref:penicillin acylase family protein n=1 Tax=Roseococcus sp. SDR TaxID=2835532 RepID=UPI001BD0C16F|nr:penicillin acylase family protein [Roseococcus sp. SDR]MBS7789552.1 penicillin acylase family protein [Roseococcus sp. SDR]MBV1844866.1 penicillin acylase family protein [Roseococcus sp. SDR]